MFQLISKLVLLQFICKTARWLHTSGMIFLKTFMTLKMQKFPMSIKNHGINQINTKLFDIQLITNECIHQQFITSMDKNQTNAVAQKLKYHPQKAILSNTNKPKNTTIENKEILTKKITKQTIKNGEFSKKIKISKIRFLIFLNTNSIQLFKIYRRNINIYHKIKLKSVSKQDYVTINTSIKSQLTSFFITSSSSPMLENDDS